MQVIIKYFLVLSVFIGVSFGESIEFLPYKKNEFSPTLKEKFSIPFNLVSKGKVTAEIYTPDGVLIRTLCTSKSLKKGEHTLEWDGKDNKGVIVPNEAYNVVLKHTANAKIEIIDPRKTSGGIVQRKLNPKISKEGKITYNLPTPSRVLIRLGIESGAMLRSVINWVPKNRGKNVQFWDGYDQEHIMKIQEKEGFKIIFSAFSLADYSIITTGSKDSYFEYVEKLQKKPSFQAKKSRQQSAKTKLMSPYYVRSLSDMREPMIDFVLPKNIKKDANGIAIFKKGEKIRIKIVMDAKDALRMEKVKYEITFFDDLDFISEEESGYVPISWVFIPKGEKGSHTLTVNIASFNGHVGLKSIEYMIE